MKSMLPLFLLISLASPVLTQESKPVFTPADALNMVSASVREMTTDGKYLVLASGTRKDRMGTDHQRYRDPSYVGPNYTDFSIMDVDTRETWPVFGERVILSRMKVSPDDSKVAFMIWKENDYQIFLYDLLKRKLRPVKVKLSGKIASNSQLEWGPDQSSLLISVRKAGWQEKADSMYREATAGPVTVHDGTLPFLKWDAIGNYSDRNIPVLLDLSTGTAAELLPEGNYPSMRFSEPGDRLTFTEVMPQKTSYAREPASKFAMYTLRMNGAREMDTLYRASSRQQSVIWNEDNTAYAYADSGKIMMRSVYLPKPVAISTDTLEVVKSDTSKAKFAVMRWSPDQSKILASSKKGWWLMDTATKKMEMVYELPVEEDKAPRLSISNWSPDGRYWYMTYSDRDKWERGLVRYDLQTREFTDLRKDEGLYQNWRMSKDGRRFIYSYSNGDEPEDLFVCSESFTSPVRLTESNPWIKNRKLTRSELIKYRDADGKELYGVLYYPVDYEKGRQYPLVCEIYESFFDNGFNANMNILAGNGFFGFRPSVSLIEGYPGEAWVKGITSGINLLIDRGLVDPKKVGVHGTSYGGYATSLLITQTDRFAAAINISGKVNIISFLGDSPRIGTRNYSAAENGQDRIGENLWDAPLKYLATTAVLHADRIKTPHLLLTGEGDWNVPGINSRELFYAMRRLGKEVVWVNYVRGGHGAGWASDEADFLDQWDRIIKWYTTHFDKKQEKEKK